MVYYTQKSETLTDNAPVGIYMNKPEKKKKKKKTKKKKKKKTFEIKARYHLDL